MQDFASKDRENLIKRFKKDYQRGIDIPDDFAHKYKKYNFFGCFKKRKQNEKINQDQGKDQISQLSQCLKYKKKNLKNG